MLCGFVSLRIRLMAKEGDGEAVWKGHRVTVVLIETGAIHGLAHQCRWKQRLFPLGARCGSMTATLQSPHGPPRTRWFLPWTSTWTMAIV